MSPTLGSLFALPDKGSSDEDDEELESLFVKVRVLLVVIGISSNEKYASLSLRLDIIELEHSDKSADSDGVS